MWSLLGMEWTPFASMHRMKSHLDANYLHTEGCWLSVHVYASVGELEIKSIEATNLEE